MKCKFHPTEEALNYCGVCDINFCPPCSDESDTQQKSRHGIGNHRCFICQTPMNSISGKTQIPPFWDRLAQIYRYPLSFDALVTLLFIGIVSAFFSTSLTVALIATIAIVTYSFACLNQTANGDFDAPGLDACFSGSVKAIFSVLIIVVAALLSLILISKYLGPGFEILFGTLYLCILPASLIVIAVEDSLTSALDPSKLISVIKATGTSYFVMLLFILVMVASTYALTSFLIRGEPGFINYFISSIVSNYYWIVICHIMGYLVYQNQSSLGYADHLSQSRLVVRSQERLDKTQLEILVKSGEYEDAAKLARELASKPDAALWEWSMAFELTCIAGPMKQVTDIFSSYAIKLNELGSDDKLSDAYLLILNHHPEFSSNDPTLILKTTSGLVESGNTAIGLKLLRESSHLMKSADDQNRAQELLREIRDGAQNKASLTS